MPICLQILLISFITAAKHAIFLQKEDWVKWALETSEGERERGNVGCVVNKVRCVDVLFRVRWIKRKISKVEECHAPGKCSNCTWGVGFVSKSSYFRRDNFSPVAQRLMKPVFRYIFRYNQESSHKWTMITTTESPPHLSDLKCRILDNPKHMRVIYGNFFEGERASE